MEFIGCQVGQLYWWKSLLDVLRARDRKYGSAYQFVENMCRRYDTASRFFDAGKCPVPNTIRQQQVLRRVRKRK